MRKTLGIVIIVVLIAFIGIIIYNSANYSDGEKAGTIVKLSKKGVLFKTWEGQLNSGMVILDDAAAAGSAPNIIWDFSVKDDPELIKKLEEHMLKGTRVMVKYKQKYTTLPWRGDTKYIVVDLVSDHK